MDERVVAEDRVSALSVCLLAPAWGALAALPVVLAARRAGTRGRVRHLGPASSPSTGASRRVLARYVPGPVRSLLDRVGSHRRGRRMTDELNCELPLVLDLLQVALSAGATPYRSLELAVAWGPPAAGALFAAALGATRVGSSLSDALETTALDAPPLAPVAAVLVGSDRLGAPAGPALTRLAVEVRADLRRRAEARARTLPVKLLFPLVFLVLPAFGLLTVVPALLTALSRT
jgi:tight adherence protein C